MNLGIITVNMWRGWVLKTANQLTAKGINMSCAETCLLEKKNMSQVAKFFSIVVPIKPPLRYGGQIFFFGYKGWDLWIK